MIKLKKIAIIYKSKYGATKKYAQWIKEALGASIFEASEIRPEQLINFDLIIYGGGLYAGGINGAKLVSKNPWNKLVVFTVGLASPSITDYSEFYDKLFSKEKQKEIKFFNLRGAMDYKKLGFIHRQMMGFVKRVASNKPESERTIDDKTMIETFGKEIDLIDKTTILPLIKYVEAELG